MSTPLDTPARPAGDGTAPSTRRWVFPKLPALIAAIALVGACVWAYPSIAAWFAQLDQSQAIRDATASDPDRAEDAHILAQARRYNSLLVSGAVLNANERLPASQGRPGAGAPSYADQLKDPGTGVMSRLKIPSIGLDLPIYHGTSDPTLLKGLGHLEGTSLPVGGEGTRSVITGHRGLAEATMFTHLDQVGKGDRFTLTTFGEVLSYRVIRTEVVDPSETQRLRPEEGRDLVTLVTCTPLGINSQRILVTAERVFPTPAGDAQSGTADPNIPGLPWWAVLLGACLLAALAYVWLSGRRPAHTPRAGRGAKRSNRARH